MSIISSTGLSFTDTGTASYYTNILQDLFLPVMADAVIYPNVLLKRLPRSGRRIEGKSIKFPIHYDDATGVSAIGAGGLLPDPDVEKFAQYNFFIRHLYVRLKFDGIMKDASKTRLASWLDALANEAEAKMKIMARARQRIYHNDGSGRLAETASKTAGAVPAAYAAAEVITPRVNQGIESPTTCSTSPMRWIKTGMIIAFVTAGGTVQAVTTVTATTATTFTIGTVLSSSGASAVGDFIVTAAQVVAGLLTRDTGWKNEPMGLQGILSDADPDDGTAVGFQGIQTNVIGNAWCRATVLSNSNVLRPVTLDLLDLAWTTSIEIGDTTPTCILGSFAGVRAYAKLLLADRRFVGMTEYDGGYKGLDYNGVPYIADRDSYNNRAMFLDETDLQMNVMADPQWMNEDGSIYSRLEERDAYQATMYLRENLSSDMRKKHTIVTDLAE